MGAIQSLKDIGHLSAELPKYVLDYDMLFYFETRPLQRRLGGRKSKPNFALFTLVKIRGGVGEMPKSRL